MILEGDSTDRVALFFSKRIELLGDGKKICPTQTFGESDKFPFHLSRRVFACKGAYYSNESGILEKCPQREFGE